MKKKIIILLVALCLILVTGCSYNEVENINDREDTTKSSMFIIIEETDSWKVVYHKESKVMYTVSCGYYNQGAFTLLVDADGTPLLYEEQ